MDKLLLADKNAILVITGRGTEHKRSSVAAKTSNETRFSMGLHNVLKMIKIASAFEGQKCLGDRGVKSFPFFA